MTQSRGWAFACKQLFLLSLCACLIFGLFSRPVKSTASYITSLSATCVNTFTGEESTEPSVPTTDPDVSTEPDVPESPQTGDNSHFKWYILGMFVSLAGLAVTWKLRRNEIKK